MKKKKTSTEYEKPSKKHILKKVDILRKFIVDLDAGKYRQLYAEQINIMFDALEEIQEYVKNTKE